MSRNIFITGAAGFVGSEMVEKLLENEQINNIIGLDIRDEHRVSNGDRFTYIKGDIRDDSLHQTLSKYEIDTCVHLATIVSPSKDMTRDFLYDVDVKGTKNVFESCIKADVQHFVVTSSGAAYGYYEDNPSWIVESDSLRGNPEFAYSDHKRIVEEMLKDFRCSHPSVKQLILRPGTVLGNTVKNQITDLFEKPYVLGIQGSTIPFVFIWDEDLIEVMIQGILKQKEGIYNMAGDGALPLKDIARIMKKPYLNIPYGPIKSALTLLKKFNLTQYGPEQINFLRFRPVLLNKALKEEFGYIPKKTSEEAFLCYLKAKNQFS